MPFRILVSNPLGPARHGEDVGARIKLVLPLIQIALAVTLLAVGHYTRTVVPGREYHYGEPATRMCYAINAPVLVLRFAALYLWNAAHLTVSSATGAVDIGIFLTGVGLLWYLVGTSIESWRRRRSGMAPPSLRTSVRVTVDLCLIILGVSLGLMGVGTWMLIHWGSPLQAALEASLYEIWALALTTICAHDLWSCLRHSV